MADLDLQQVIQNNITSVKQKMGLQSAPRVNLSAPYEALLETHALYDFFGLNFGERNSTANSESNKKLDAILDFVKKNFDGDVLAALKELETKFGAKSADMSLLDHLYHSIKFRNEAEKTVELNKTPQERVIDTRQKLSETMSEISKYQIGLETIKQQYQDARAIAKTQEKISKLEQRRIEYQSKIDKLLNNGTGTTPASATV